jgi:hypothetical protein
VDTGATHPDVGDGVFHRRLWQLTLAGLLARVAFLLLEPATGLVADELTWTNWALDNLVTPKVGFSPFRTHMVFYPPLYPYFIAVPYALFHTLTAVKWLQVGVAALLVPAVGRVGACAFGGRVGLVGAAVTAFYPELIWFSVHFWCETLFMALLWWAIERLVAADATGRAGPAISAGFLWGLSVLTRETALYFAPLAALWLAAPGASGRKRWATGGAFLLTTLLTVAPWTLRNWIVFEAFVPVSTSGGLNLFQGNALLTRQEVYDLVDAVPGRIEQYRYARHRGLQAILERQPSWFFEKLRDEMPNFWEADSLVLIHVKRGLGERPQGYGPVRPGWAVAVAAVVLLPYLALLALLVYAVAVVPMDRTRGMLVAFLLYYNLLHIATHGFARYRLPVMPVVFLLAGAAFVLWREKAAPPTPPSRLILAGAVAVTLVLCVIPSLRRSLAHPAFGFAAPGPTTPEDAPVP